MKPQKKTSKFQAYWNRVLAQIVRRKKTRKLPKILNPYKVRAMALRAAEKRAKARAATKVPKGHVRVGYTTEGVLFRRVEKQNFPSKAEQRKAVKKTERKLIKRGWKPT